MIIRFEALSTYAGNIKSFEIDMHVVPRKGDMIEVDAETKEAGEVVSILWTPRFPNIQEVVVRYA